MKCFSQLIQTFLNKSEFRTPLTLKQNRNNIIRNYVKPAEYEGKLTRNVNAMLSNDSKINTNCITNVYLKINLEDEGNRKCIYLE